MNTNMGMNTEALARCRFVRRGTVQALLCYVRVMSDVVLFLSGWIFLAFFLSAAFDGRHDLRTGARKIQHLSYAGKHLWQILPGQPEAILGMVCRCRCYFQTSVFSRFGSVSFCLVLTRLRTPGNIKDTHKPTVGWCWYQRHQCSQCLFLPVCIRWQGVGDRG